MNTPFNIFQKPTTVQNTADALSTQDADLKESRALVEKALSGKAGTGEEPKERGGPLGSASNPMGFINVPASIKYLSRLRIAPGAARVMFRRKGSVFNTDVSQYPIDVYALSDSAGQSLGVLYVSGYQQANTRTPPDGFTLSL